MQMTLKNNLGKEKILVDKDKLLQAYIELDQIFSRNLDGNLNFAFMKIEQATGLYYERSLVKKPYDNKK